MEGQRQSIHARSVGFVENLHVMQQLLFVVKVLVEFEPVIHLLEQTFHRYLQASAVDRLARFLVNGFKQRKEVLFLDAADCPRKQLLEFMIRH